jgi:IS30 family transposase
MPGSHLTEEERGCIFYQQMSGWSNARIARQLHRHRGTIGRELKRFRRHPSWPYYRQYFPDSAQALALQHRHKPRGPRWTRHRPLLAYVLRGLRRQWSPQQIAGRLPVDFPDDPKMRVSHQTLYTCIQADRQAGGVLWKHLRQSCKRRRKTYGSGPRRGRIPDRVGIEQRPKEADARRRVGHWEADTVVGRCGRLATCVERKSRYVLIARLPDGTACQFNAAVIRHFRKIPRRLRKTLTADNGSEFVEHGRLGKRLGFRTFFAHPYRSWERGTNENTNGLLRQYCPKRSDFAQLTPQRVARIEYALNNRPRKCLAYRTPAEVLGPALRL